MHVARWMCAAFAAILLSACVYIGGPHGPPSDDGTRLLYEIHVTSPGTRSQGWRGTLFESNGAPIALAPGQRIDTPAGRFIGVRCELLWRPCGAIHEDMLAWMQGRDHNIQMGRDAWIYRVYAHGFYGDRLSGELLRNGRPIDDGREVQTPMGPYRWIDDRTVITAGRRGWFHVSWWGRR